MPVRFLDVARNQCRRPLSGEPGPEMMVCGAPAMPGKTHCAKCKRLLYFPLTKKVLRTARNIAVTADRRLWGKAAAGGMPAKDIDDHIGRL